MADEKKGLAIKAALMYYEEDMTQGEIADVLYISRSYVSQLLKYAREQGIVQIDVNIDDDSFRCFQKEEKMRKLFPVLNECYIMESDSQKFSDMNLGKFAAPLLVQYVNDACVIGVTPGNLVDRTVQQMKQWKLRFDRERSVVQMMGSFNLDKAPPYARPNEVVDKLSRILKCSAYYLNCPAFINSDDLRHRLLQEKSICEIIQMWNRMDLIIVGIGVAEENSRLFSFYDNACKERILNSPACGEINTHYFDINGTYLPLIEEWTICTSNDIMKNVKKKVALCAGEHKSRALLGALRSGVINALITDSRTIDALERLLLIQHA